MGSTIFPANSESGIPSGNTASRPTSPVIGDTYYNGTLGILEMYTGSDWIAASSPPAKPTIATPTDASTADAYTSTAGKLSVVFTEGASGGIATQFNAYTTAGSFSAFNSTSAVTITGLTPGTPYAVYGNTQNTFGTSINTGNSSSVTPTTLPEVPTIGTATASISANEVTVKRIESLQFDRAKYNILVMDLQGNELKALQGAEKDFLMNIDAIYTEINFDEMYEGCAMVDELDAYLMIYQFYRVETGANYNNQGWTDAFYIKRRA
jgi:FkbM family methyltransferase